MYARISDSDWVRAICVHEAVHVFYNKQFGATDFDYYGPRLDYIRETDDFDGHYAAIQAKPYEKRPMTFAEGLELEARLAASGSVCAAKMPNIEDHGKGNDYSKFEEMCDGLNARYPALKLNAQARWDKAVSEVEADIEKAEIKAAILAEAEKIRQLLFPWATLPIVLWDSNPDETSNPL